MLYRQAKILILDEPTAVLTPPEISAFLNVLRQLAACNHTIIFISHKLDEIMAVCDAVTVLRRGRVVASLKTSDTTRSQLARLMVDRLCCSTTIPLLKNVPLVGVFFNQDP